ncbi:MAG: leucine--tRNA ligase [Planctomycetes bacterium]|nr:leucine--tRNA ligase [Planctomycetota bacterium]
MPYEPATIEPRWQAYWEENKTFRAVEDPTKPKYYVLDMFPYPSGAGLHVGHPEGYTATDIVARYKRMAGFSVLHPMGWDAFGLPPERAAVREEIHPAEITKRNTDNFRRQIKRLGFSYDWDREVDTSSASYYRWTQWIFLRLHERGLAYQAEVAVNWCPALGTVLANEEVSPEGTYKETGDPVEKRMMRQWMLRITAYADRLTDDLDDLDWPEPVKKMQRDWIGRSHGAEVRFSIHGMDGEFAVFTTRPDTLFGATYCVLAPEHGLVAKITTDDMRADVTAYVERAGRRSERDRRADAKEKTGVFTGAYAVNPINGEKIPVWIADYVLAGYGTGAIMAVPAHDERDHAFAKAFSLPIRPVVRPANGSTPDAQAAAFQGSGVACNSGDYDGLDTATCKETIVTDLEGQGKAEARVQYALRDWLFSRQRYWGEPFPMVKTADGTAVPLPDDCLPITLPHLTEFKPTDDGRPPLARASDWLQVPHPETGEPCERETNTMPQWAGSCWYYLRFCDARNEEQAWSPEKEKYWLPVDLYIGGTEHAVLHLLYARFWHKVLFDLDLVSTKEPFQKLFNQGMIRAYSYKDASGRYYHGSDVEEREGKFFADGIELTAQVEKMSKSKLNVVNPDQVIDACGADAMRLYEMFMGPLEMAKPWQTSGIEGVSRFLNRVWRLFFDEVEEGEDRIQESIQDVEPDEDTNKLRHATVAAVTEDIENLRFNTAISRMMEFVNAMNRKEVRPACVMKDFVKLVAPFAPHLGEELWRRLGHPQTIAFEPWPSFDPSLLVEDTVTVPVQVNGKVRARLSVSPDLTEEAILALAKNDQAVQKHLSGKELRKVIYRPGRMLNLVVG